MIKQLEPVAVAIVQLAHIAPRLECHLRKSAMLGIFARRKVFPFHLEIVLLVTSVRLVLIHQPQCCVREVHTVPLVVKPLYHAHLARIVLHRAFRLTVPPASQISALQLQVMQFPVCLLRFPFILHSFSRALHFSCNMLNIDRHPKVVYFENQNFFGAIQVAILFFYYFFSLHSM